MLTKLFFYILISNLTVAQINGWLKDQEENLKDVKLLFPHLVFLNKIISNDKIKIKSRNEDVQVEKELDDRYSVDNLSEDASTLTMNKMNYVLHNTNTVKNKTEPGAKKMIGNNQEDPDMFVFHFPEEIIKKVKNLEIEKNNDLTTSIRVEEEEVQPFYYPNGKESNIKQIVKSPSNNDDVIEFNYSNDGSTAWKDIATNNHEGVPTDAHDHSSITEESMPFKLNQNTTEHICTYLKKTKCYERNGSIYTPQSSKSIKFTNAFLICCLLTLPMEPKYVPDSVKGTVNRFIRSNKEVSTLTQRDFLLRNKISIQSTQPTASLTKIFTSPDEDFPDPYWNIKSSNFKAANKQGVMKQEYYQDYVEDYVAELPRPGLVGLYSDNGNKPSWPNEYENPNPPYGGNDYSEESDGVSFGYSTIDPRRVTKSQRKRPVKITTEQPEEDSTFDIESQTVNFQSNPNFQVLHGFKILNLGRTKNKYTKNSKRSTTESSIENESSEGDGEERVFRYCGKTLESKGESENRELGEAEPGSHPWLAVVVPSRRPQNIMCYATIIHPRMAITAGDCVSEYTKRASGKDVLVVVAALREVKERLETQNRIATVQLHPQWRKENMAHNLAILHWNRPLRLNMNVQPACLSQSNDQDDCKFYGWGGFDQAIRKRARWQKASVVPPNDCTSHFSKATKLPADAFCATVKAKGTVTGLGGSLICIVDGRATSVGVAVYRDRAIVLIPAQEWVLRAMEDLNID